jgi:hypothetical protein
VAFPSVPIVFGETRKLAQEWAYRFLGAALAAAAQEGGAAAYFGALAPGDPLPAPEPTAAEIRRWAAGQGLQVSDRGRVPAAVRRAFDQAHQRQG